MSQAHIVSHERILELLQTKFQIQIITNQVPNSNYYKPSSLFHKHIKR
jgi:hypothetical protein